MNKKMYNNHHYRSGIDYNAITNIEQLRDARMRLRHTLEIKEAELSRDIEAFKEAINPVTYLHRFITKLYSLEYFVKYFIQGFNFVKKYFNHAAGPDGETPAEETSAETENKQSPDLSGN